nr:uncharacterized protein LOC112547616 [Pelodiscus sinensis]|eukprot:XP_025046019.1 uncharacterized protein LOC112547616 [Pelodiscus sinensis]
MRRLSSPSPPQRRLLYLQAWCKWLPSLLKMSLSTVQLLWRLVRHALFCHTVFWELTFHLLREVSAALGSWLESCSEACEEGGTHTPDPELQQAGAGPGELHHANPVVLDRLVGLEAEVKYVSTELRAEKLLWSSRYLELLREQQALRDWFQEWGRSRKLEAKDSLEMQSNAEAPSRAGSDGWCMGDSSWDRQSPSGGALRLGQRAKVLLQAGGIGVGTIRYLGVFPEQNEFSVGVELEAPEQGAPDGALVGHCCFPCQPGRGVFVPFRKVLMVWD